MDESPLSTKVRRYAQVGTALTKVAARTANEKLLGKEIDHESQSKEMTLLMGALKGPLMKVAQFLSTVPDALPDVYTTEFTKLQSQAPSMGWPFVKRRMQTELGSKWEDLFAHFEKAAASAASLGQVHRATSLDGTLLACKLQYPNMSATLEADLTQLRLALKLYEATMGALETGELLVEISDHLRMELDYVQEAQHMRVFGHIFQDDPEIFVPTPIPDLSTHRLLTMTWLEGTPLLELQEASQEIRNNIAKTLFRAWYLPLYHYGILHGDPHLGNYTIKETQVNLLDFGCVRLFSPDFIQSTLALYSALKEGCLKKAAEAYEAWGFGQLTFELVEALNLWAQMLYEPLLDNRVRFIQEDNRGLKARERAGQVHACLRKLGGVRPPREFVFLDRAAVGIGSAFMHLTAQLNWHELFEVLIENASPQDILQRQTQVLSMANGEEVKSHRYIQI